VKPSVKTQTFRHRLFAYSKIEGGDSLLCVKAAARLCCFFMTWKGADIPDIPDIVDIIYDDVESYQPPNLAYPLTPLTPFKTPKPPKPI